MKLFCPNKDIPKKLVGDPGFEPGSKRPKRPSIGQANPIAPCSPRHGVLPMKFTQELASDSCQVERAILEILRCQSGLEHQEIVHFFEALVAIV